jgi:hypothetical protein
MEYCIYVPQGLGFGAIIIIGIVLVALSLYMLADMVKGDR